MKHDNSYRFFFTNALPPLPVEFINTQHNVTTANLLSQLGQVSLCCCWTGTQSQATLPDLTITALPHIRSCLDRNNPFPHLSSICEFNPF